MAKLSLYVRRRHQRYSKPERQAGNQRRPGRAKDGITSPPADAIIPTYQTSKFTNDAVLPLGGSYTGDITTEFDVVFDSEVGNTFDGVIMYDSADARDMTYAKANVLIQFNNQTINIMNGSGYKWTAFPVAANYRYHFKVKMNAATKKYSVWITPTWPLSRARSSSWPTAMRSEIRHRKFQRLVLLFPSEPPKQAATGLRTIQFQRQSSIAAKTSGK